MLDDPDVQIVIELVGGLEPARTFIMRALAAGKHVVTANKALLAHHGDEIFAEARRRRVMVGFEAAVAGGIPLIRAVKEGLPANRILSAFGIVNGTCNYILSKMTDEGSDFAETLKEAQAKGYAEADPTLDVEGLDSAHKLQILASLAFRTAVDLKDIYTEGIAGISRDGRGERPRARLPDQAPRHREGIGRRPRGARAPDDDPHPVAARRRLRRLQRRVHDGRQRRQPHVLRPRRGPAPDRLGGVVGRARHRPARRPRHPRPRRRAALGQRPARCPSARWTTSAPPTTCASMAVDQPGVLAQVAGILGRHDISLVSVLQKGRAHNEAVPVVMMTHEARERDMRSALAHIDKLPVVASRTTMIRVEADG